MSNIAEFLCGQGYHPNWQAISAVATAAAVIVALWIPFRERREKKLERAEQGARAAKAVNQSLTEAIEIFPNIIVAIKRTQGALVKAPGNRSYYGIAACEQILDRESFCYLLPTSCLAQGQLITALAKQWIHQIEARLATQADEELKKQIDWREHSFVCDLGETLHTEALRTRELCISAERQYESMSKSWFRRAFGFLQSN